MCGGNCLKGLGKSIGWLKGVISQKQQKDATYTKQSGESSGCIDLAVRNVTLTNISNLSGIYT